MERKLPETLLDGIPFLVDIQNNCLQEKNNPNNRVRFMETMDIGTGYDIIFDRKIKNHGVRIEMHTNRFVPLHIPYLKDLDPVGAMLKYNTTLDGLKNKSDLDLILTQPEVTERLRRGYAEIKIGEEQYKLVIAKNSYLVSLHNPERIIYLSHLKRSETKNGWEIFYDPERKKVFSREESLFNDPYYFQQAPKELQILLIPSFYVMDPIGLSLAYDRSTTTFLLAFPIHKNLTAEHLERIRAPNLMESQKKSALHVDRNGKLVKKSRGIR